MKSSREKNQPTSNVGANNNSFASRQHSQSVTHNTVLDAAALLEQEVNPPVSVDIGNGFITVPSHRIRNNHRHSGTRPTGPMRAVPRNRRHIQPPAGIQPATEGQVPTALMPKANAPRNSNDAPLFPLRPMQFPLPLYEFRLACAQCFKEVLRSIEHTCHEDLLIVRRDGAWRLIREPKIPTRVRRYYPCRYVMAAIKCPKGDSCYFPHNKEEAEIWNLQNQCCFRINDFITSNRTPGSLSRYTVESLYQKHQGSLGFICRICFKERRSVMSEDVNRQRCNMDLHALVSSKILAHHDIKTGRTTLIEDRPFKHKNAFFNMCRYERFCRKNVRCSFAHSMIEYDLWYVQRDNDLRTEQILQKWQFLSGTSAASAAQWQVRQAASAASAASAAARSASETITTIPISRRSSYSSVRKISSTSESAVEAIACCPFNITVACSVCKSAGHISGQNGDRCVRNHLWDMNKVFVLLPSKKVIRKLPQDPPRRWKTKFYMCKHPKDCRYGNSCQFAHNDEEFKVWTWMATNNVKSLEAIVGQRQIRHYAATTSLLSAVESRSTPFGDAVNCWFPDYSTTQWFCEFCSYHCSSQLEYKRHSSTVTHQFNVDSDKDHQWNFRQPPWNICHGSYRLCPSHISGKMCRYSHVPEKLNYCTFPHSEEELDEWKERYKWREMKKRAAKEDNLYSYMNQLITSYNESGHTVLNESVDDVTILCSDPVSVIDKNKLKVKEWTFQLSSEALELQTVALLYEDSCLHFSLIGDGLEENCQIADGEVFQSNDASNYEVRVRFTGGIFGSFRQWIVFDFGQRPVLVRKLSVELGRPEVFQELQILREKFSFNRWTSKNRKIVPFETTTSRDEFTSQLLAKYKEPCTDEIKLQSTELNRHNYKHKMHSLINLEELAQAKIIATVSQYHVIAKMRLKNAITDEWGGARYSHSNQLFAKVDLETRLLEGSLMSTSVTTALLTRKDCAGCKTKGQIDMVYEALITDVGDRTLKGKDHIYLTLSAKCCADLGLKNGDEVEVEIQFQLDRAAFCRSHFGIDNLKEVDFIFPESEQIRLSAWEPRYKMDMGRLSGLNEDQRKVIDYASKQRQTLTYPLVVYGPFGTGKTKTLAEAAIALTANNEDVNILICTLTNPAADEYILRYFHPSAAAKFNFLRVYDKNRRVETVDRVALHFSLVSHEGNNNFREPTERDIKGKRIVVTTLETSLVITRLDLRGHFTHIFIDEAAQANECRAVMPLCLADERTTVILAGDHIQMTEAVHSEEARQQNFHISLVERLVLSYFSNVHGPLNKKPVVLFTSNYRSHPEILKFVSQVFYGGQDVLKSIGQHTNYANFPPLAFHTAEGKEAQHSSSTSFYNVAEIHEIVGQVEQLLQHWPPEWGAKNPQDILVTTPYTDQMHMIRFMLRKRGNPVLRDVAVLRVLAIPGREFRAVFISTVRTRHLLEDANSSQELSYGFLTDEKMLNSALTRARSSVVVIGDPVALCAIGSCSKIWRQYLKHCSRLGSISPSSFDVRLIHFQVSNIIKNLQTANQNGESLDDDNENEAIYASALAASDDDWNAEYSLPTDFIVSQLKR